MPYEKECGSCIYWTSNTTDCGECRRHSPKVITDGYEQGAIGYTTAWPETRYNDECGDYKGGD